MGSFPSIQNPSMARRSTPVFPSVREAIPCVQPGNWTEMALSFVVVCGARHAGACETSSGFSLPFREACCEVGREPRVFCGNKPDRYRRISGALPETEADCFR